jgi:hypothetical protein
MAGDDFWNEPAAAAAGGGTSRRPAAAAAANGTGDPYDDDSASFDSGDGVGQQQQEQDGMGDDVMSDDDDVAAVIDVIFQDDVQILMNMGFEQQQATKVRAGHREGGGGTGHLYIGVGGGAGWPAYTVKEPGVTSAFSDGVVLTYDKQPATKLIDSL